MSPDDAIRTYCTAFEAGDADAIVALFAPNGLYEMPFLTPPRLVGAAEIRAGMARIFALTEARRVRLDQVKAAGPAAIAEGRFEATVPRDDVTITVPFAMVAETAGAMVAETADAMVDSGLKRLSLYCDARPWRLWTDGPVMALGA